MVIALVRPAIAVVKQVYKHRQQIYRVLSAQDKYIDKSMRLGGYGKAARWGVRHGALVGSLTGSLIAPDTPGNDDAQISKPRKPRLKTSPSYKTRSRQTRWSWGWCPSRRSVNSISRRSRTR